MLLYGQKKCLRIDFSVLWRESRDMAEEIRLYENKEVVDEVMKSDQYAKFIISENTLEALEDKCNKIMQCQKLDWKPLKIERLEFIRMYNKIYYYKKW